MCRPYPFLALTRDKSRDLDPEHQGGASSPLVRSQGHARNYSFRRLFLEKARHLDRERPAQARVGIIAAKFRWAMAGDTKIHSSTSCSSTLMKSHPFS